MTICIMSKNSIKFYRSHSPPPCRADDDATINCVPIYSSKCNDEILLPIYHSFIEL